MCDKGQTCTESARLKFALVVVAIRMARSVAGRTSGNYIDGASV